MRVTCRRARPLWPRSFTFLLLLYALGCGVGHAQLQPVRRVLILNEVSTAWPGIPLVDQGIRSALETLPQVEIYREYMDTIYFPDPADQQRFREFYIRKYQNRRPDVIITVGPSPLKFMVETHKKVFPGVPVVFCLPNWAPGTPIEAEFTGVESSVTPVETLEAAFHLNPAIKHVVVVGGTSAVDLSEESVVKEKLKPYEAKYGISYLPSLSMPDVIERLKHLPNDTIVLVVSFSQDAAGSRFTAGGASAIMADAANVPVFSLASVSINHGEVGGKLTSLQEQGKLAGELAARALNGEKLQSFDRIRSAPTYMFDWRALKRWGFRERDLPPGSIVLNRRPTVWEANKWYIVGGLCLLIAQTSLIVGLLWQRANRRSAEAELGLTYDRLRLAVESGKAVGWDLDGKTRNVRWFGDLPTMFGFASDTFNGQVEDFYRHVHLDDRELVQNAVADSSRSHTPYVGEFRVVREDQAIRWITARGKFYYGKNGDVERMVGMALDITDRKLAEQQMRESQDRLAAIVGSAMDAIIAIDEEQRILLFNPAAENMFGCSAGSAIGTSIERFIPERFRAEHRVHIRRFGDSRVTNRVMGGMTGLRSNGEEFPIESSISQTQPGGAKLYTVVLRDVTERARTEATIRESEQRFRLVANTAPVMIWMSGTDKLCTYFNQPWLNFTGRTVEQEFGNGWAEGVHSEDFAECLKTYTEAFDARRQFEMQYRLRRHDGEYRWILDIGVPRFNADGTFAGYIGSCIDVTERKRAEESLSTIGRRLIEAHEEERTWIGRELHDDVNQRLALLAVELDQWSKERSETNFFDRLRHAQSRIIEISGDVQALSHRLHSSKLDYLGLAAAAKSFCKELSEKAKVEVQFSHSALPSSIPKEVSLCLFRVLQESLQNAIKYSGVRLFQVQLQGSSNGVELTVSDDGKGFDEREGFAREGLGLISMRERLQMVQGHLDVKTNPGAGTTIVARVPSQTAELRAKAG